MFRLFPLLLAALLTASPAAASVDLVGTWFVLIHYKDSMTANADADRWEDKVWKIEKKGSRLQWTEYPIVVFEDGTGRFGRVGRNPRARMLHKWEPNEAQMAEIKDGLQVNSRGSKTKSLRGSPKRGYKSSSASRSVSAMTVGYQETWSIDDPTRLPIFTRDDALGTESALATKGESIVSGRTRYATLEISDDGDVLTGTYARDENKRGTFKLIRAGAPRGLESDGRTPNEKARDRVTEQFQESMRDVAYSRFLQTLGDDTVRDLRSVLGEEKLSGVWAKYEQRIIAEDPRARIELRDELTRDYIAAAKAQFEKDLIEGDLNALLDPREKALADAAQAERFRRIRSALGEEKLASLRSRYGDKIRAGDEGAKKALRDEIRSGVDATIRAEFMKRLEAGDPEATRQMREMQRKERDHR